MLQSKDATKVPEKGGRPEVAERHESWMIEIVEADVRSRYGSFGPNIGGLVGPPDGDGPLVSADSGVDDVDLSSTVVCGI